MQSFFYLVLNAPKVYAKLTQEIVEGSRTGVGHAPSAVFNAVTVRRIAGQRRRQGQRAGGRAENDGHDEE